MAAKSSPAAKPTRSKVERVLRRMISVREAHERYGPSEDQWFRWIANGDVEAIRPPNCRRVWLDREDVERLLFERWKERGR